MDVKKTGAFIARKRKEAGMTQEVLGEKLGVSNKTVSRWENGNYMPDIGMLVPLSEILGVTLNELLSGEEIPEEQIAESSERSMRDMLGYAAGRLDTQRKKGAAFLAAAGMIMVLGSGRVFGYESSWCSISAVMGIVALSVAVFIFLRRKKGIGRSLTCSVLAGAVLFSCVYAADYAGTVLQKRPPAFRYSVEYGENMIVYRNMLCNVYRINRNTENEYYIVDTEKKYTESTVPMSPFDRDRCGSEEIREYENRYIGNASNISGLVNCLPLAGNGAPIEIDSRNMGVRINYGSPFWYGSDDGYTEKALVYNSAAMFTLIENLEYVEFVFPGSCFRVNKSGFEKEFPDFSRVRTEKGFSAEGFDRYVENRINSSEFAHNMFEKLFKEI